MDKLTEVEQAYLANLLFEDFKKQSSKIDGRPEISESIVTKYWRENSAMFQAGLLIEDYKDLIRDSQPDYSPDNT